MKFNKVLLGLILLPNVCLSENEIWLQDTNCVVVSSDTLTVEVKEGSLITYICTRENTFITCSSTTKTGEMYGNKPSTLNKFLIIGEDHEVALWQAITYNGTFILDLKNKRYSTTSIHILPAGLFNKHCVGEIKNY